MLYLVTVGVAKSKNRISLFPQGNENKLSVEEPRALQKVILHMVTNLHSPKPENNSPILDKGDSPTLSLAIIPPKKERIISAIDKIHNVIKIFTKDGVSPTKGLKKYYKKTNSAHKSAEDEIQGRVDCETDVSNYIEDNEFSRQLDVTSKTFHQNIIPKDIERVGRLYRFFLSRNRPMNQPPSPLPATSLPAQQGVVYRPVPIYQCDQPQLEYSQTADLEVNISFPKEKIVSSIVEPTPGPSGLKRRREESSHEQSKMRKTPGSDSQNFESIEEVCTSTVLSTSCSGAQTNPALDQTVVSLFVPFAVCPNVSTQSVMQLVSSPQPAPLPGLLVTPQPALSVPVQFVSAHFEPLLLDLPVPQILQQQELGPMLSISELEKIIGTPDQALIDLGEFPEISKHNY